MIARRLLQFRQGGASSSPPVTHPPSRPFTIRLVQKILRLDARDANVRVLKGIERIIDLAQSKQDRHAIPPSQAPPPNLSVDDVYALSAEIDEVLRELRQSVVTACVAAFGRRHHAADEGDSDISDVAVDLAKVVNASHDCADTHRRAEADSLLDVLAQYDRLVRPPGDET